MKKSKSLSDQPMMQHLLLSLCLAASANANSLYNLTATDIDGNQISMSQYAGNVSLVVNVATY